MVKELKKPNKTPTNTINSILSANKTISKSRQQIYQLIINSFEYSHWERKWREIN